MILLGGLSVNLNHLKKSDSNSAENTSSEKSNEESDRSSVPKSESDSVQEVPVEKKTIPLV